MAHEIPSDLTAHLYVKPEDELVRVLVRVPLSAMRDVEFPETADGYLDVDRLWPQLPNVATVWIGQFVAIYEGSTRIPKPRLTAMQISLPSDRSFTSFERALAHVTGPRLATEANVTWDQVMFDVMLEYPAKADVSTLRLHSKLAQLAARVTTVLRLVQPDGRVRAFEFAGDPGPLSVEPRWYESAWQFLKLGFFHILDGIDHLLFLLCLAIPSRRPRTLLAVVTAFTVAHSFTLIASALDLAPDGLWFPPLVEMLIAASIVYMALENIVWGDSSAHRRWMTAFAFGLIHGFGFSFALRETLQFAGGNLLVALLSFNLGVEFGQVFALAIMTPLLALAFRFVFPTARTGVILLSALVAHTGWHWSAERFEAFRQFRLEWPSLVQLAVSVRWLVLILVIAGLYRLSLRHWRGRLVNS